LIPDGGWVDALREIWETATPESQAIWSELLTLCRDGQPRSGKPWLDAENEAEISCGYPPMDFDEQPKPEPGSPEYQQVLAQAAPDDRWLERIRTVAAAREFQSQLAKIVRRAMESGIGTLNRNTPNKEFLRAVIWAAALTSNAECIEALRQLAAWSVEHKTAQAKTIGVALAFMDSELAAAALRMVAQAAKRPSPKTRFNRYASHVEEKIGLNSIDSAERFIPTFELDASGIRRVDCGEDGSIELRIVESDAVVRFFNNTGKAVGAAPAALKRNHTELVETIRESAKALEKLLGTQRSRLESLFLEECVWDFSSWRERYLKHPVVSALARRLIWKIDGRAALFHEKAATDSRGQTIECRPQSRVQLWHPIDYSPEEVLAWRNRLSSLEITQPFKQAHREVYVVTDAELHTRIYSNRFAAHILNQSQFRALALARGWDRPLIGAWDSSNEIAHRKLPSGWEVEFWIDGAGPEHGPKGALLYIATDQVRFQREGETEPIQLNQVPRLIFSEAMRDVDLFVGVASVGNNPAWNDGGPNGRYREYWQSYSFGELNATAKTRKQVLEHLLPRLNIGAQCSFEERFLVVRGQLRTYKIHLGSGNILMEPNDQYLCIVPKAGEQPDGVFLPFEGDRTLSVILSKAFLLAKDSKISDETITRQISLRH
jgi:hypothetical protein